MRKTATEASLRQDVGWLNDEKSASGGLSAGGDDWFDACWIFLSLAFGSVASVSSALGSLFGQHPVSLGFSSRHRRRRHCIEALPVVSSVSLSLPPCPHVVVCSLFEWPFFFFFFASLMVMTLKPSRSPHLSKRIVLLCKLT
jgi:hypothetical protein